MTGTETADPLRVAVIIGSTREGRAGGEIAEWFVARARRRAELAVEVLDLVEYELPGRYPNVPTPPMAEFARRVGEADAFVVVTPEYTRSFPASLKQAIDSAYDEWRAKPVGFVSYGCRSDGMYAVEQLRTVFNELHTVTMRDVVGLNLLGGCVDDRGWPRDLDALDQAATALLDQLTWWTRALRDARAARPYAC